MKNMGVLMMEQTLKRITMEVNGRSRSFIVGDAEGCVAPSETLLDTIRERLGLTAAKRSCEHGACGCCTVIVDGEAVASCMVLTADLDGKSVTTLEGLCDPVTGALSPLQQAFADNSAFQCGYCTPGIIMSTHALLMKNPKPTEAELTEALSGNYCRCISHYQVIRTVMGFIKSMNGEES
jgi:carbon-monoxide dehydrogenase small subunit